MLSLTEYILKENESRWMWFFVRSWIPKPAERFSWLRIGVIFAAWSGIAAAFVWGGMWILFSGFFFSDGSDALLQMRSWMTPASAEFGALSGLVWGCLSRMCWNARSARIAASGQESETGTVAPKRGGLGYAIPALVYEVLIKLVTPLLLFHAIENVRGAWAWRQVQAELKAAGECFQLECIIPPPVRDEDNFFATPFWKRYAYRRTSGPDNHRFGFEWEVTNRWEVYQNFSLPQDPREPVVTNGNHPKVAFDGRVNLAAWANQFRWSTTNTAKSQGRRATPVFPLPPMPGNPADDVLLALSKFDPELSEFSAAASRPHARYPHHFEEGFGMLLPALNSIKSAERMLQLRAIAYLDKKDTASAAKVVRLMLRLAEVLSEEPLIISQFVRFNLDRFAIQVIWQGMVDHRWNEAQLAEFQSILASRDYRRGSILALEAERAIGNMELDRLQHNRTKRLTEIDQLGSFDDSSYQANFLMAASVVVPDGWIRHNQIAYLRGHQILLTTARMILTGGGSSSGVAAASVVDPADEYFQKLSANLSPKNFIARMLLPGLWRASNNTSRAQVTAQLAMIACALERHYLAQGTYPRRLDVLTPTYLASIPNDFMSNAPYRYEPTQDGWYQLWSVGADGKDDHGVMQKTSANGRREGIDLDWPWPSPKSSFEPRLF